MTGNRSSHEDHPRNLDVPTAGGSGGQLRILVVGDTPGGHTFARLLQSSRRHTAVTLCGLPASIGDHSPTRTRSDWPTVPASSRREAAPAAVDTNELAARVAFADGATGYYDLVVDTNGVASLESNEPRVVVLGDGSRNTEGGDDGVCNGTARQDSGDRSCHGVRALAEAAVLASALAAGEPIPDALGLLGQFRERRR